MGSVLLKSIQLVLLACGAWGSVYREWRTYVPYYVPNQHTSYNYAGTYLAHLLPPVLVPSVPAGELVSSTVLNSLAPLGSSQTFGASSTLQTRDGQWPSGGNPTGYGTTEIRHATAAANGGDQHDGNHPTTDVTAQTGASQRFGDGQTSPSGSEDVMKGYTMYQSSEYSPLLDKVIAALQANGPELTARQINFAGHKTVGSESHTGPGVVNLVNFRSDSDKNCFAYLVEPTGKKPEIPKESIACAT